MSFLPLVNLTFFFAIHVCLIFLLLFFSGFFVWLLRKLEKMQEYKRKKNKDMEFSQFTSIFGEFLVEYGFGKFPFWLLRKLRGKESKAKERIFFFLNENGETSFIILTKFCCF